MCDSVLYLPLLVAGVLFYCCDSVCDPGCLSDHLLGQGLEQQGRQGDTQGGCHWMRWPQHIKEKVLIDNCK